MVRLEQQEVFPDKERRAFWIEDPERNRKVEERLRHLLQVRASWFEANIRRFDWISYVPFEHALAGRFGKGLCWLVGDAAHQTGPAGVQSLNVGLREAEELAARLQARTQGNASAGDLEAWEKGWRGQWEHLLGLKGAMKASDKTDSWVRQNAARLLPCLPASGEGLASCLRQLHLEFP